MFKSTAAATNVTTVYTAMVEEMYDCSCPVRGRAKIGTEKDGAVRKSSHTAAL